MVLVAVIGAGVIGLTTALKVLDLGYDVVVIAELFPNDPKSIRYTSNWAGANHASIAGDDKRQEKMDHATFDVMWKMSAPGAATEKLFMRVANTQHYSGERVDAHHLEYMPGFRYLSKAEVRSDAKWGLTFNTVTIDIAQYLAYLYMQVILRGGRTVRAQVQHISQVAEGSFTAVPDALVICAGLGARLLGGVEDKDVYPIRGQSVIVHAPWMKIMTGETAPSAGHESGPGVKAGTLPRPNGDVFLGGTRSDNDWFPHPRPSTTQTILERALELVPELAPPDVIASGRKPTVADIEPLIVSYGCGLRPGRKGGIRLEAETFQALDGRCLPIVHNYGHAGQGFQSSWGSAGMAAELLEEALKKSIVNSRHCVTA